jgi:predicted alpha/beta hydrolase family esterase
MKQQILVINGGTTFNNKAEYIEYLENLEINKQYLVSKIDWKGSLSTSLGASFEVLSSKMPNSANAQYLEWKLYFERVTNVLDDNLIIIGHSLGGIFITKYLSENIFPKKIKALILLAAPYEEEVGGESLGSFNHVAGFKKLLEQVNKIYILHSKDDLVVPYLDAKKYQDKLIRSKLITFDDKGHFNQEEFNEIIDLIREISNL